MSPLFISARTCHLPCGELLLGSFGGRLCLCDWMTGKHHAQHKLRLQRALGATMEPNAGCPTLQQAAAQLEEYATGQRQEFSIPLLLIGTDFQRRVWQQLQLIPCGHTITYAAQACRLGIPAATRATANANAANALAIFIPCHRVISSSGRPGGYSGGAAAKRFLLEREGALPRQLNFPALHQIC